MLVYIEQGAGTGWRFVYMNGRRHARDGKSPETGGHLNAAELIGVSDKVGPVS